VTGRSVCCEPGGDLIGGLAQPRPSRGVAVQTEGDGQSETAYWRRMLDSHQLAPKPERGRGVGRRPARGGGHRRPWWCTRRREPKSAPGHLRLPRLRRPVQSTSKIARAARRRSVLDDHTAGKTTPTATIITTAVARARAHRLVRRLTRTKRLPVVAPAKRGRLTNHGMPRPPVPPSMYHPSSRSRPAVG
jgi:hypothetical protein